MKEVQINIEQYLKEIHADIENNKSNTLEFIEDNEKVVYFFENSLEALKAVMHLLSPTLISYNYNPFWSMFLTDWKPGFRVPGNYQINFLKLLAVLEVIVQEIRITGKLSTVMTGFYKNVEDVKAIAGDDGKAVYYKCKEDYENHARSSIFFWRLEDDIKENYEKHVDSKFVLVKDDLNKLKGDLSSETETFESKIQEVDKTLNAMVKKAGFLSLYAGFDKYAAAIKKKLLWLFLEKIVWITGISGAIIFGLYLNSVKDSEWTSLIPLAGVVLFFSTLLKVNLKKTDQYEQIMSKVEHKLAVSTFYQSELIKMEEGNDKQAVNEEYYKFLFSNIETTEWNTPDIASDIAKILKSYKS
tara:strand:+ start:388 stop:1458 length:1071 start_codon:yes stop_codon:yes gene_type:complete